ncbi:protein mono-ADP-ribosyltransferase PARP12-like [Palaemon carinicauda]|uniref:protein mono-ADP-ribosyltransferase PARP12-like n=1 Tax=Palaemon carinicauda TaxID=392227 RepID=UPI0035B6A5A2
MGNSSAKRSPPPTPPAPPVVYRRSPSPIRYVSPVISARSSSPVSQARIAKPTVDPRSVTPTKTTTTTTPVRPLRSSSPPAVVPSPPPRPPVVGHQSVIHSVDNYCIPASKSVAYDVSDVVVPYGKIVDKFFLFVCPQYNSREGCHATSCRRFHVCYYWVLGNCNNSNCVYDHTTDAFENILSTLQRRRDVNTSPIEVLKENHRFNRNSKRKNEAPICMFYVMGRCKQNACSRVHSKKPYQWEVKNDETWWSLSYEQSDALEELFCQPEKNVVELLPVPKIPGNAMQNLRAFLKPSSSWKVNFQNMEVYCNSVSYELRRLSTASDICCLKSMNRVATRWVWYWQADDNVWIPYKEGSMKNFYNMALSDKLEHYYNFSDESKIEVTVGNYAYTIDVNTMVQENKTLGTRREIRRRPVYNRVKKNKDLYFNQFFTAEDNGALRQSVPDGSPEFLLIKRLMNASMNQVCVLSVERIINPHQWKAYQNKKHQMKLSFHDNQSLINEQYLFHGTKHRAVDEICKFNFDWRLHGSNVGNVYGHGVYFSNDASLSNSYSETDSSGVKVMFIALVLVGSMAVGDGSMKFPPKREKDVWFDTTCDREHNARIFVKYNRDEYYPAYIAHFRDTGRDNYY